MKSYLIQWLRRQPVTVALHVGFLLVLAGALVTHFTGIQGQIRLSQGGAPTCEYTDTESSLICRMPFALRLDSCRVLYYPASGFPMDYVSYVSVTAPDGTTLRHGRVAMNDIFVYRHWRFYQTGISEGSSTLTISHDPAGIALTYAGYGVVALSMILFFFQKGSLWRRRLGARMLLPVIVAAGAAFELSAENATVSSDRDGLPRVLQPPLADNFARLHVCGPQRMELLGTMALDFTRKVTGKSSWRGFSANQVFTGWLFYYDSWKREPMIRVCTADARRILGIDGDRAAITDFFSPEGYKLAQPLQKDLGDQELRRLDEVVALVSAVATGTAFRIYPVEDKNAARTVWISWTDRGAVPMNFDDWEFVQTSHAELFTDIASGHFRAADTVIHSIAERQSLYLPAHIGYTDRAEGLLNTLQPLTLPLAVVLLLASVALGAVFLRGRTERRRNIAVLVAASVAAAAFAFSTTLLILRGIAGRHWPLSDGYETLLFLDVVSLGIALGASLRKSALFLCGGLVIGGFSLLVAHITSSAPKVTPLLPVLSSPWLAIHVMLVMTAYALMAFMAVAAAAGLRRSAAARIARINYTILVPAVAFLMAGIMTGAVWANQSWGRYWGWDPKETCALVTLLIYALPLHTPVLRRLGARRIDAVSAPRGFNLYILAAILAVLFTYFGVNYLLPGLHSYA